MSLFLLLAGFIFNAQAQTQKGLVSDEEDHPLQGAWVAWPGISDRIYTDASGAFQIPVADTNQAFLVAGCPGFQTDTFEVKGWDVALIQLTRVSKELAEVHIVRKRQSSFILMNGTVKTEVITQKELTKAACCDMAGCFETQGSVQPQTTNVLTNSKELRILGLSGVYNQVLMDGLPLFQGLTYTYGISSVPSSIIDKIYVAKGANSVLQGFENISGQINVITRNPEKEPRIYANAYLNNFGEKHLNASYSGSIDTGRKWNTLLSVHQVLPGNRRDRDGDGFLDLPLLNRTSVFNRWNYGAENQAGYFTQISLRATKESRLGGQRSFSGKSQVGSDQVYGQWMEYWQPEMVMKLGYRFSSRHAVQFQSSAYGQDQLSWYGTLRYRARQQNVNALLQHQFRYSETAMITWGGSFRHQRQTEDLSFTQSLGRTYAGNYQTPLQVPGLFAEHSAQFLEDRLTWLAGVRLDRHSASRYFLTPRTMVRFEFRPGHTLRASAGTGWRQVNLFAENIPLLAGNRNLVFEEKLKPEQALNWGGSYTWNLDRENLRGTLSLDFFQTRFQNQFFPDYTRQAGWAYIRNFTGTSVSNSAQVEGNFTIREDWEWKLAYNFVEVFRREGGKKEVLPFNPRHRVMSALSYRPSHGRYFVDGIVHWFDRQQLPDSRQVNGGEGPAQSKPYATFNLQATYVYHNWDWYAGIENAFDFRQKQPIASWQTPFGPNFDTSTVWGPTRGREYYLGFRWKWPRT